MDSLSTNKTEKTISEIFQKHFSVTNLLLLFLLYTGITFFYSISQELEFINKFTNNEHIITLYIIYLIIILLIGLSFKLNKYYKYYNMVLFITALILMILFFLYFTKNMYQSIIYLVIIVLYLYIIYSEYVKINK